MPQPKGRNGRSPRSHRDDARLHLHDILDGLEHAHRLHAEQYRATAVMHAKLRAALTSLDTADQQAEVAA